MGNVLFGPSSSEGKGYDEIYPILLKNKLYANEIAFTYGPNIKQSQIDALKKQKEVHYTVHGPYFVNLASKERSKLHISVERLKKTALITNQFATNEKIEITFHAGFYQERTKEDTRKLIIETLTKLLEQTKEYNIIFSLETTGKPTQFGDLDELLELRRYFHNKITITVDFAHLFARNNGQIDYDEVFNKLIKEKIEDLHCHFSGINYGPKGEKNHLPLTLEFAKPLLLALKKYSKYFKRITIINESPYPLEDAIKLRKWFEEISKK